MREISVVMLEGVGNLVMMTPVIEKLHEIYPDKKVHLFVDAQEVDFAINIHGVARRLETFPGAEYKRISVLVPDKHHVLINKNTDLVVLGHWGGPYNGPMMELNIRRELEQRCKEKGVRLVCGAEKFDGRHESDMNIDSIRQLGYEVDPPKRYYYPKLTQSETDRTGGVLISNSYAPGWNRKGYPHWPHLVKWLEESDLTPTILYHHSDQKRMRLEQSRGYAVSGSTKTIMVENWNETITHMQQAEYAITPDSGFAHVAAMVGVRTLALFGPTLQSKNRPLGDHVRTLSTQLPCSPCQYTENERRCFDWQCMQRMTPQMVFNFFEHQRSAGW